MYDTYQNLKNLSNLWEGSSELNEIAEYYQETKCPIAFSYVFVRVFKISVSVSKKFWGLTDEDKASFTTEELHKSLMDYDYSKNDAFHNFFSVYLRRRYYAETTLLNTDKRKANSETESFEGVTELFEGVTDDNLEVTELELSLDRTENLTENERAYCKIIVRTTGAEPRDSDVAKLLGVSSSAINQIKKRLAKKLLPSALL